MKKLSLLILCLLAIPLSAVQAEAAATVVPEKLRIEYLDSPKGLDIEKPRFSWILEPTDKAAFGQKQTAYRIEVATSPSALTTGKADMWNSGWVASDETRLIPYAGKPLHSDRSFFWRVQVKDERGAQSDWSAPAQWSTGLFSQEEWRGKWIGSDELYDRSSKDPNISDPWLRKKFTLSKKPGKAALHVASVGYHEVYVNGERVSEEVLAPAATDHTKRARYVTYDIADKLKAGDNVIALWLGTSWSIFPPYVLHEDRPLTPIVIAQADIYEDPLPAANAKPMAHIATDGSWKTHPSPNRLLGTWNFRRMGGEIWDDNKAIPDWNLVSFNDSGWKNATEYAPKLTLSAQQVEGNRLFDEIRAVEVKPAKGDGYKVDMGVNFTGWTEIKVKGNPGDTVRFQFSEREPKENTFDMRSAIIIGPSGEATFRNRFNYSAGRWITIHGLQEAPKLEDIRGWMIRTDFAKAAEFKSSDDLQNWINDTVLWTFDNLSLGGYIVDCSQRERMGYGGDAHATSETGMYHYDLGAFYTKWLQDWRDVQGTEPMTGNMLNQKHARKGEMSGRIFNNGIIPHTAPTYWGGGGPAWGGIVVTLPWFMFQHYGDTRALEDNFAMIEGWLGFLETHRKDDILQRFGSSWDFLGDWLWPGAKGRNNDTPENLCFNNSYYVFNLRTAAQIARQIGRTELAKKWDAQADASAKAVHKMFYNEADHSYSNGAQWNLAAALLAGIPPTPEIRAQVMQRLEKQILETDKGHIGAGITGGAMLFKLLRDEGRDDLLYAMLAKTEYPGWGFMREQGATSIWESWEAHARGGHSMLHSSYLYPGAWYVEGLAGIRRDPQFPGFRRFILRPAAPDATDVKWAKASYDSPVGEIVSDWSRESGRLVLKTTVPPNSTALLQLQPQEAVDTRAYPSITPLGEKDGFAQYLLQPGNYTLKQEK